MQLWEQLTYSEYSKEMAALGAVKMFQIFKRDAARAVNMFKMFERGVGLIQKP